MPVCIYRVALLSKIWWEAEGRGRKLGGDGGPVMLVLVLVRRFRERLSLSASTHEHGPQAQTATTLELKGWSTVVAFNEK